jgi:hypothetical protein
MHLVLELNNKKNNMKKSLLILLLLICNNVFSQDLIAKWSEKIKYDNYKFGFFDHIVGSNSKYIFVKFNMYRNNKKADRKIRFVSFDRNTMKKVNDVPIVGFKENKANKEDYKGLKYHKTIVFENQIYVFWIRESKKAEELFVQGLDPNLKPNKALKKIYEIKADSKKSKGIINILGNKKVGEKILIYTSSAGIGSSKMEYKILNSDFTFSSARQIEFGKNENEKTEIDIKSIISNSFNERITYKIDYGDDGNIHISFLNSITVVKAETGEVKVFNVVFPDKKLFDFDYIIDENGIRMFGLFCDLKKDKTGNDNHGIFSSVIDTKTMAYKSSNFEYFSKEQLDRLFANDNEDRKDSGLFASKNKKKSEENSIASNYGIEFLQKDGEDLVLFCSRMYNYTSCTTNSQGVTTCRYYCRKDNVTGFKISSEGKIIWATNLDRRITYDGSYVYDVNVMKKGAQYYVSYGSAFDKDSDKKGCFSGKSSKEMRDNFEYAVFDAKTGNPVKKEMIVNKPKTPKLERKRIKASDIQVYEDNFYVVNDNRHVRIFAYIPGCFFPPLWLIAGHPIFKTGYGNFGIITTPTVTK